MEFSRQEYWSGLPHSPTGALPDPGTEPSSLALTGGFLTPSVTWESLHSRSAVPNVFWYQGLVSQETIFPWTRKRRDGLKMIQAHCIYCVLYLKSNAAADLTGGTDLQPGGWGPLF